MPATMPILNRLAGKRVVLSGKFGRGDDARLAAMIQAQQGAVQEDLDAKTDYLVLPDLSQGKTVQKKAQSLNAKGAAVQVVAADAFEQQFQPTREELIAMIRGGQAQASAFFDALGAPALRLSRGAPPAGGPTITGESFDGGDLTVFNFTAVAFDRCSFVGANITGVQFGEAKDCDFSRTSGEGAAFGSIDRSRFIDANLAKCRINSHFAGSDFTGAVLDGATLTDSFWGARVTQQPAKNGPVFARASMRSCHLGVDSLQGANFDGADLSGAHFRLYRMHGATFRRAVLRGTLLTGGILKGADFSGADLTGANLAEADLTDAKLDGADFSGVNLRGAILKGASIGRAKNLDPAAALVPTAGPAIRELDAVVAGAENINFTFQLRPADGATEAGGNGQPSSGETMVSVRAYPSKSAPNTGHVFIQSPTAVVQGNALGVIPLSKALLQAGSLMGHQRVRFETLEVKSTKSPKGGAELKDLVTRAIAEAFSQNPPEKDELSTLAKAHRGAKQQASAARKEYEAAARAAAEKEKEKARKQVDKQVQRKVGKVTDIATFLKALELRIEKPKIAKATSMLKASGFKLYNDVAEAHLAGVVKSQTDADLVYACRITSAGKYSCCTQNLNVCGGLRGSICKHLLVLIIGLVQAGELDPATIDGWVAKTNSVKPELDREVMGEIFIRYKGAEAGEVDWRPTQTVPEDYYAV